VQKQAAIILQRFSFGDVVQPGETPEKTAGEIENAYESSSSYGLPLPKFHKNSKIENVYESSSSYGLPLPKFHKNSIISF